MNRAYVERIKSAAQREFVAPVAGPVEITIVFKDWSSRPDVDNVEKVAIDALKGIVLIDDKQVRNNLGLASGAPFATREAISA